MLTKHQQRQLDQIDTELYKLRHNVRVHSTYHANKQYTVSIVLDSAFGEIDWYTILNRIMEDVDKFNILLSANYIREMLRRAGIFGVAICCPRDKPDIGFGAFVAKARLLKHIKNESDKQSADHARRSHSTEA